MIDIKLIRDNPDIIRKSLANRQIEISAVSQVLDLDDQRREIIQQVEVLKAERNLVSKEIGRMQDQSERQRKIE